MNTKEYIDSGILEAYILGALSKEEMQLVEANIAQYPDLRAELDAIETTMQQFATTLAMDPPANMQDKIWGSLNVATDKHDDIDTMAQPKQPIIIPFDTKQKRAMDWKYAAVLAILAGSLAVNFILYSQSRQARDEKVALNTQMQQLQTEHNELSQVVGHYTKANTMMADTGMQTIVMHTMQPGHAMAATLYWSKGNGEAYVAMNALPEPPKGMQYQLWVIQGGKPVSMGTLPNNMASTPSMQKVNMQVMAGEAFAISLEKEGGNPTPTTVYVLGKA